MSNNSNSNYNIYKNGRNEFQKQLRDHWRAYAFQGVLLIVIGVLALIAPLAATLASVLLLGWLLVVGGILGGALAFQTYGHSGFWANLALSILIIILGMIFVYDPFFGAVSLTWLMGFYFILSAIAQFTLSRNVEKGHGGGRFALVLSGLVNLALAVVLLVGLPATAVWAVGVYLGISLMFGGSGLLVWAVDARKTATAR